MVGARLTDCDSTRELIRSFHHSQYALERLLEAEAGDGHGGASRARGGRHDRPDRGAAAGPRAADRPGARGRRRVARRDGRGRRGAAAPRCTRSPSCSPSSGRCSARATRCGARSSVARGELVVYLDSDTRRLLAALRHRAAGPAHLRAGRALREGPLTGARSARPTAASSAAGGGRVTELTARPLLSAFFPELAGVRPAARRRGGRAARVLRAAPVRHRLRGRDGDAAARARRARRHRRDGAGGPRRAAQPPPAARGPRPDGVRGAAARCWSGLPPRAACSTARRDVGCRSSGRRMRPSALARSGHQVRLHRPRRDAPRAAGRRSSAPLRATSRCSRRARSRRATGPAPRW